MPWRRNHQFFLACKRAPVRYRPEDGAPELAPGGVANLVAEFANYLDAPLSSSAATEQDLAFGRREAAARRITVGSGRTCRLGMVEHDREVFRLAQDVFFPQVLWPALHNLWEPWRQPVFDATTAVSWRAFRRFNADLANALLDQSRTAPRPVYLLQDYQLACAPAVLREARPDSHIQLFVHPAWGSADGWRKLPREIRTGILTDMCAADQIGLFCARWAENFLTCVTEFVDGAKVDWDQLRIDLGGRSCRIRLVPLGYSPEIIAEQDRVLPPDIRTWAGEDPLVVTYGRTDPVKNAARAVEAFRRAVLAEPRLAHAKLLVRMAPNHLHVDMNRRYTQEVAAAVAVARSSLGRNAVRVVEENDTGATLACYRRADLLLFTPIIDGLNMGPFEGVMVNERAAGLILSETTGAAAILADVATLVNPFDVDEQAVAIRAVLTTSAEERERAAARRRDAVARQTLRAWFDGQLEVLA